VVKCYFKRRKFLTKRLEAYTFFDFIMKVQEAVQDGWVIDPDDPEGYPQAHVGFYRCSIHKKDKTAALLLPKVIAVSEPEEEEELAVVHQPFVPSVVFTMQEEPQAVKRPAGRSKASTV
jgi:hypothetical protein